MHYHWSVSDSSFTTPQSAACFLWHGFTILR